MIEKRIKNIFILIGLIVIRQLYFLGRNWYLMISMPYLTLKEVLVKKDKSQLFLISLSALWPVLAYVLARIVWDLIHYRQMIWLTGKGFETTLVIQAIILGYWLFWVVSVLRKEKINFP